MEDRQGIEITISKDGGKLFKQIQVQNSLVDNSQITKLVFQRFFGDHGLCYVSSVQAVHTIASEVARLRTTLRGICKRRSKEAETSKVWLEHATQDCQPTPIQVFTLAVEVKRHVSNRN